MSRPERCLVAAPGGSDCHDGEHDSLQNLQHFVSGRMNLRIAPVLAEMVRYLDVGAPRLGHTNTPPVMLLMTEFKTCRAMEDECDGNYCDGNYNVPMRRLFAVTINHGAGWRDGLPLEEQVEWDAHASFMDKLVEEEFV